MGWTQRSGASRRASDLSIGGSCFMHESSRVGSIAASLLPRESH